MLTEEVGRAGNLIALRPVKIVSVCVFKEMLILATERGVYRYDETAKEFKPIRFETQKPSA